MNWNMQKVQSAKAFAPATSRGGKNILSISVTFTELNGKRLTLSNYLIATLNLAGKVFVGVVVADRKLVLANHQFEGMDEYKLSKGGNIYNAGLVSGIIAAFGLQPMYQNRTSHSFNNIEVDNDNGIAVVTIPVVEGK